MEIGIYDLSSDFAEDKDVAARIRDTQIRPALQRDEEVFLNFHGVDLVTQSFVHAMLSDVLRTHGEGILDRIGFVACQPGVRGIIETVIQYSLETLEDESRNGGHTSEHGAPG